MLDRSSSWTTCVRARVRRLVLLAVLGFLGIAGTARAWDASTPPVFFPSPFDTEYFASVARQANGGLIVAGTHGRPNFDGAETECTFVVARLLERTGTVDWRTELEDCGSSESNGFNPSHSLGSEIVRIDEAGDVFVARWRRAAIEVVKLDGTSGALSWRQNVAQTEERNSTTLAIALDPAGDVVVAGGDGTNDRVPSDLFVTKLAGATGTELWRRELRGAANDEDHAYNRADAVAIDASGNVVVHGVLYDVDAEDDVVPIPLLLALDGTDGHERWRAADGIGVAADVVFDDTGGLVVAGGGEVAKIDVSNGAEIWRTRVGGAPPTALAGYVTHVVVRSDTIAVAAEASAGSDGLAVLVTALDAASGAERWQRTIDSPDVTGPLYIYDRVAGVGIDEAGDVVVAASIVDPGAFSRPLVAAFDGESGDERWRRAFAGTASAHAGAFGLLVDGTTAVVVGGVGKSGAFSDAFVALLTTTSGNQAWIDDESARLPTDTRGIWLDEIALDAAIDPRGDVVAVGETWSGVEAIDFAVRKLAGASGATRWRNEEPRSWGQPRGLFSFATAERVAIGGDGDPVVLSSRYPTTLVKLAGTDGDEVWTSSVVSSPHTGDPIARPLAIDAAGDVFVSGDDSRLSDGNFDRGMVVDKLDGGSGSPLWSAFFPSSGAQALELTPSGDVIALSQTSFALGRKAAVVKYDGATGTELWRHVDATAFLPELLAVDATGSALVAARREVGTNFSAGIVVKVDGASGTEIWQSAVFPAEATALVVDGRGDVFGTANDATYVADDQPLRYDAAAVKLDADTGSTLWHRSLADLGKNVEVVAAVLDTSGDLIVAAREVPGRTWLAGLRGSDGTLQWTIGLGDADTTFDVRALRLRAPGEIVVAGGRSEGDEGSAFAVLALDVSQIVGPPTPSGRSCTVQLPASRGPARLGPMVSRCTSLGGRATIPTHR